MEENELKDVLLVTSDEKSRNYKWEDKAQSLKGIQVVSEENELEKLQDQITFVGYQRDKEQVFVKSPFNKFQYIEITKAEEFIFKNKIKYYKRIAFLLGAKSFSAQAEFIDEKKLTTSVDGKITYKVVDVNLEIKKERENNFKKSYQLEAEFTKNENFDRQRAFKEASDLVKELNLHSEIDLVGLIENNDPSCQNKETKQTVKLQLTNELNDLLEVSFNLNTMGEVFGLNANFKTTTESIKRIILDTEIVF